MAGQQQWQHILTRPAALLALLLVGCGAPEGCGCGAGEPQLSVSATGLLRVSPGALGKLPEGARLSVVAPDAGGVLGEIVIRGGLADGDALPAALRCAPPAGLPAGVYGVQAAPTEPQVCERWGEVADPSTPTLKLPATMEIAAGALLRVRRPADADEGQPAVWGRLGAPQGAAGERAFELLLPVEPPALRAGQRVDLSTAPGSDLTVLLGREAARQARAAWLIVTDEQERLGDEDEDQTTLARLFGWADAAAERAAELGKGQAQTPGDPTPDSVWATWLTGLRARLGRAREQGRPAWDRAAEGVKLHLPTVEERAEGVEARAADLDSLRRLLDGGPPERQAPTPRPPRPKPEPKRQELTYLPFSEMPNDVKEPYRYIRAIPVNPDPARFAERPLQEVRQEQVLPLLRHATAYLSATAALTAERKAPEPRVSCRVIFALDNVKRGAKVYGSTAEDIDQARQLSHQLAGRLLEQGRRECYRMMRSGQ